MSNEDYERALGSAEWQCTRALAIVRAGGRCQQCGSTRSLEVHHLTYERLGWEYPSDLECLCSVCHNRGRHGGRSRARVSPGQEELFDAAA